RALRDYAKGRFLHEPTGGGDHRPPTFYGETIIPPRYVEEVWAPYLAVRAFRDEANLLPQALIVAQKVDDGPADERRRPPSFAAVGKQILEAFRTRRQAAVGAATPPPAVSAR